MITEAKIKDVSMIFGRGSAIYWSEATVSAICCASDAAPSAVDWAKTEIRGAAPILGVRGGEKFQDFMLILDPESTCKCYCNIK